ncbi:hypothetical protein [Salipiger mangrovisoli]|uniref:Tetratricopeptide repeat-containing protein n=1 Tax=Salipiger mangrovisoli TaxID=2865933 RepID=A0ABR9X6Z6_9RHOB|nr:hypothetical protein [Salipiger mangrovisoli]MBE9639375.1 hypothetical protein [Salipiger mangrovisoli]
MGRRLGLIVALGLALAGQGVCAEPVGATAAVSPEAASALGGMTLDAAQLRIAALRAVQLGQFALAAELGRLLLRADPADPYGHFVVAQAELRSGHAAEARAAARQALRYARSEVQRHEAARVMAAAYALDERYFLSQIWMRRALMDVPSEALEQRAGREYKAMRGLARLNLSLELTVAPSSNVNGGASEQISTVDGLPLVGILSPSAQALSGTEARGALSLGYAVQRSPVSETSLRGYGTLRRVWLSDEAQEKAPELENSDFGSSSLELGVEHRRRLGGAGAILGASATLGRSWQGGTRSYDYRRGALSLVQPLGMRTALVGGLSWQRQVDAERAMDDVDTLAYQLGVSHDLGAPGSVSMTLMGGAAESENGQITRDTRGLRLGYEPASAVGPLRLAFALSAFEHRFPDYRVLFPVPGGRRDEVWRAGMEVTFERLDYAGFVPVLDLNAERSESNVSRFETETLSVSLGFKSRF